jgi:glycosyltransferase involved in cell wall biosynthesis
MTVSHFVRNPFPGQVSIERVQRHLAAAIPASIQIRHEICPFQTRGMRAILANIRACRTRQGDVNHVLGDTYYVALGLPGERTVLTYHDVVGAYRMSGLRRAVYLMLFFIAPLRRARVVTAVSEATRIDLESRFPSARGRVRVIPNPVDPAFVPLPRAWADPPTMLQVGTRTNKNLEAVARALAGLPVRMVIVGEPTPEQRKQLTELKVDHEFLGSVSDNGLRAAYEASDALVFASTFEGFGLPILEAQAIGRPVITSNLEPMRSVCGNGGILCEPADPASIREAVESLLRSPDLRDQLVSRGFQNVSAYRADAVAERYAAIYQELASH